MIQKLRGKEGALAFLPKALFQVRRVFEEGGIPLYLCGGSVRDLLLGRFPADLDLATPASPGELRALLPPSWILEGELGERWGSFHLQIDGCTLEVTSFRSEGEYGDHRHPLDVHFQRDLGEDWQRRDFTINALYQDLFTGEILDPCRGMVDLFAKRLRTVGNPWRRFEEDPLRILRGLRLSAELGFVPEGETWAALRGKADRTRHLSGTRVSGELQKIFLGRGRARGLRLLRDSGVLGVLLPELQALEDVPQPPVFHPEGPVLLHTECVLANLPEPVSPALAWAALLHDTGKKDCFTLGEDRIRFHGHDQASSRHAKKILDRFGVPKKIRDDCRALIEEHIRIASFPEWRGRKKETFLRDPLFLQHLGLHWADCMGSHRLVGIHKALLQAWKGLPPLPPRPLLNGKDLIQDGWKPGPLFRQVLDEIEEMRAAGRVQNKEDALLFAREFMRNRKACR